MSAEITGDICKPGSLDCKYLPVMITHVFSHGHLDGMTVGILEVKDRRSLSAWFLRESCGMKTPWCIWSWAREKTEFQLCLSHYAFWSLFVQQLVLLLTRHQWELPSLSFPSCLSSSLFLSFHLIIMLFPPPTVLMLRSRGGDTGSGDPALSPHCQTLSFL